MNATEFTIVTSESLAEFEMGVAESDVLFNFTTAASQSMNESVPWRGAREKDPVFLQLFIEAFTKPSSSMHLLLLVSTLLSRDEFLSFFGSCTLLTSFI